MSYARKTADVLTVYLDFIGSALRLVIDKFSGLPWRKGLVIAALGGLLITSNAAAKAKTYPKEHRGPFGLKWGKSPADARSILANKVQFVEEKPAEEAPYHTIDQRYSGTFGKLPTVDIVLRFYQGEFFYMAVTLATTEAGSASKVWQQIVGKMQRVYGKPLVIHEPQPLASMQAIVENLPVQNREAVMPLLWNERLKVDAQGLDTLRDLQIKIGLWDPFAGWRFPNKVIVQTFMHQEANPDRSPKGPLKPVWIFAKEDRFKLWRKQVRQTSIIEPRDF